MTKIWLKLQLHFSQKTTTKTKLKSAVKINTGRFPVEALFSFYEAVRCEVQQQTGKHIMK